MRLIAASVILFLQIPSIAMGDTPSFRSSVDVGLGSADEDGFFLLYLEQGFTFGGLDLQLSGPFRFNIIDNSPDDSSGLRSQDWDEASDFARILRSATFKHTWQNGTVDIRLGEQNGVGIGHGSVADAYFNSTDMDHYQGGLLTDINVFGNGVELMVENVIAPEIYLGRAFIAPLAWFFDGDWPQRLELGYTLGVDSNAPRRVSAANATNLWVTGGDISLRLIDESIVTITPYMDFMIMDGELGFHGGLATTWFLTDSKEVLFHLRGEYRALGSDYYPALFNPFYEYNRRYFSYDSVTEEYATFADHLALEEQPTAHGFMVDATFDWHGKIRLGARYDYQNDNRPHWIMFRLDVTPSDSFSVGAFYAGQDIEGGSKLFSADSLISLSANFKIIGPLRSFAEFSRRWRRDDGAMNFANETGFGAGLLFTY